MYSIGAWRGRGWCPSAGWSQSLPHKLRPMYSDLLTVLFAAALVLSLAVKLWLGSRQMRYDAAHRHAVPP